MTELVSLRSAVRDSKKISAYDHTFSTGYISRSVEIAEEFLGKDDVLALGGERRSRGYQNNFEIYPKVFQRSVLGIAAKRR